MKTTTKSPFAKVVAQVLEAHGIGTGPAEQVAQALSDKLGELKKVSGELAVASLEVTRLGQVEKDLTKQRDHARGLSLDYYGLAELLHKRVAQLKKRDERIAELVDTLVGHRITLLKGGDEAEKLRRTLGSVTSTDVPKEFGTPATTIDLDRLMIMPPSDSAVRLKEGALDQLEKGLEDPKGSSTTERFHWVGIRHHHGGATVEPLDPNHPIAQFLREMYERLGEPEASPEAETRSTPGRSVSGV